MQGIFKEELKRLLERFTEMGLDVGEQIYQATKSFIDHDRELAQSVVEHDEKVNVAEVRLEDQAINLMALQQPVANDFRQVIVVLKASSELERIGDHAVGIAKETIRIKGHQRDAIIEAEIAEMTHLIRGMLDATIDAYVKDDGRLAKEIIDANHQIETSFKKIRQSIASKMKNDAKVVTGGTGYLMVASYLERIGDHVINVVEWIMYNQTGKITELSGDN
ncbi:phosphate signaling complex protein PhoU [Pediococcus acidilactici]|jgi:phosphate transport system protein|uniref:phosphate signaling complex protein PhoU n=1 Tax=Pediococcus acidilactici TaxID=1254 RepID=UPI0006B55485|nr:phosphate signaling complex protein PhoU [Pediococcus acidilactici]KAF0370468.1 phosphate signaling complex protein PhoU [Pediococcus acidilactici]KAF0382005.1 phosphate signaling complex protein PhoU [Pediococcus acidilactici]KAF0455222.1 phosphate signaling complex protein PhoU [Pediococcus acidilactici]KAF0474767.1 phosphate signaling complex protein PhoU [Pediococcus acidilactici]KAF0535159.1 phosphate signaling complex protein PhoU [Pediococcus acidilactici]